MTVVSLRTFFYGLVTLAACLGALLFWMPTRYNISSVENRHLVTGEASEAVLQLPLEVAVWNICKGSQEGFAADFAALASSRQLLLLQEHMENKKIGKALEPLTQHMQVDAAISFRFKGSDKATGVATASVVRPSRTEAWITKDREPVVKTPKATLVTWYPIALSTAAKDPPSNVRSNRGVSARLLVVNIHGINIAGFGALKRQLDRVRPIVQQHKGPVVFAGDFNTNTSRKREYMTKLALELNLQEMTFEPDGRMTAAFGSIPLDYVYTRGLAVEQCQVLIERTGSDHKALTFRVVAVE